MATVQLSTPRYQPQRRRAPSAKYPQSSYWLFAIIILQVICQLGMTVEVLAPLRIVFRSAGYAVNMAALALAFGPRKQAHHPVFWMGLFMLIWIGLQILNPGTNTPLSALATWIFIASVLAPLFWVPRLEITPQVVRSVLIFLWAFHTLSSCFGVLQVYFPGQFQPAVAAAVKDNIFGGVNLQIQIAGGETIFRPMGLTDTPGGAASAGLYAFVFGLGLFALSRGIGWSLAGLFALPIGLFCIYVSQVRVTLILAVIISVIFAALLGVTRHFGGALRTSFIVPIVMSGAFLWAVALGGEATVARFETLIDERADDVYMKNRGSFLTDTYENLIPEFPFGAGLGRWGQVHTYFGDGSITDSSFMWSEIQWSSWIIDGGIVLAFAYTLALFMAMWATGKVAFDLHQPELSGWAMLILAYDVAIFALTFSFVPFYGPQGVEFWMLNAMIWTAARNNPRRPAWAAG